MALALVYDPRYHSWDSWASLMSEAYSAQHVPIPGPRDDWRSWAIGLKAIDVFTNEAIPSPDTYEHWQDWAFALVGAVNQKTDS
jgi:hypothetical protein